MATAALRQIGAPVCDGTLQEARDAVLRGQIEAQRRAELFAHPLLSATGDAAYYLLDDDLVAEARSSLSPQVRDSESISPSSLGGIFAEASSTRFSEQIEALEQSMFDINEWQPDNGKTRQILEVFAWLTGDKAMSDYRPSDITYLRPKAQENSKRLRLGEAWPKRRHGAAI